MTSASVRRVLFRCDGADVPSWLADREWTDRKAIASVGPATDLTLHVASLGGAVLAPVGARAADLIRIAAYAYRADQTVSRGGPRDAHASRWKRHLALCVPVNDPAYWSDGAVTERLQATLRFLTDDLWEFAFCRAGPELRQLPLDVQDRELLGQPTVVTLLSGGVDSLCALVEAAASGERPVAVGHWSTPAHRARQEVLRARAREHFPGWNFPLLGLPIHRRGAEPADASQRTRGFLYASLGAAFANAVGVGRVAYGDNGPVSVNLPINDQLVGALASRSTHPVFLARFNRLVADLFPSPVVVANPLGTRTRAEALEVLKATRCAHLLPLTLSCSKWRGLPAATPHCGGCSQCVDRRFATVAAGLEAHDPAGRYKRDVFLDDLPAWDARTTAESYVRFARRVYRLSDEGLVEAFPQIYDAVVPGDPHPEATVREVVELAKRHAATALGVVKEMTQRHLDSLVEGRLPATCLLRLAVGEPVDGPVLGREPARAVSADEAPALGGDEAQEAEAENVFAFEGEMWTVSYRGATTHLKPNVALTRIACLLAKPRREFTAAEMLARTGKVDAPQMADLEAELLELSPEAFAGGGFVLDRKALAEYGAAVQELLRDLAEVRDRGETTEVAMLEEQVQRIVREMKAGVGSGGKPRPFRDSRARRQEAVYQSIHRGLPRIAKAHPALGDHLDRSVRRGTTFSYAPEGDVRWRVVLPKN